MAVTVNLFGWAAANAQGPSSADPHAVLASWSDATHAPNAAELYSQAIKLYEEIEPDVARYEEAIATNNAKRLKLLTVGKTYAANEHLGRIAKRLSAWGEPAGHDLRFRSAQLTNRLNAIHDALAAPNIEAIRKSLPVFQARAKKYQRVVTEAEKLFAAGKLDAAESKILPVLLDLTAMAWWYDSRQIADDMRPYVTAESKPCDALDKANAKLAVETITALRDKATPDFKALPAALDGAAAALKSAPTPDFAGKSLAGPAIFLEAIKGWLQLQEDGLRALALNQALYPQQDAGAKIGQITADATAMQTQVIAGLVKLIDADAARATADEAAAFHAQYIDLVAKLASIVRHHEILKDFDAALDRLAAKSPKLKADIAAYRGATEDLLRWRNRAANALAKTYRQKASDMPVASVEEIRANVTLPAYLAELAEACLKKEVVATGPFLPVGKSGLTGGFSKNALVRVRQPPLEVVTTLEADLLATGNFPPLTVAAAKALRAAERGLFLECGGTISKVELIGAIPFLATETPFRRSAIPPGTFVPEEISSSNQPQLQLVLVAEITPHWIRGDGFFAVVTP